ncbi:hypothetical protein L2E82_51802 [Cichorium intybus]|nr:hypothetical protein L2E82_51802 [Cichorium intybus]
MPFELAAMSMVVGYWVEGACCLGPHLGRYGANWAELEADAFCVESTMSRIHVIVRQLFKRICCGSWSYNCFHALKYRR